jgi:hypothetical protein
MCNFGDVSRGSLLLTTAEEGQTFPSSPAPSFFRMDVKSRAARTAFEEPPRTSSVTAASMKLPTSILAALAMLCACGPPDDKVRTAEDAVRVAEQHCQKASPVSEWHAERQGDTWIARFGDPDAQGQWRFTARIKAADGNPVCDVALPWSKS